MWPFKRKVIKEPKIEEPKEEICTRPNIVDVLHGENPWWISYHCYQGDSNYDDSKDEYYTIDVYRFDKADWRDLSQSCKIIAGISEEEYARIVKEYFKNNSYYAHKIKDRETAEAIIEKFKPYYDSFYMPRAVMDRLACYTEGGIEPWFMEHYTGPIYEKEQDT